MIVRNIQSKAHMGWINYGVDFRVIFSIMNHPEKTSQSFLCQVVIFLLTGREILISNDSTIVHLSPKRLDLAKMGFPLNNNFSHLLKMP